ncbi:hypothetical protein E2C01_046538 [Portunus trituberculatus]|uniref:Uncharacterized protein n=1 Tax=Portunus trituberculatus TaxID=210409 RepID=A0A5B7G196_PORTR|nr:hypothetical protein [Portunus trituberculatus]
MKGQPSSNSATLPLGRGYTRDLIKMISREDLSGSRAAAPGRLESRITGRRGWSNILPLSDGS